MNKDPRAVPHSLTRLYSGICLTAEEKARKNLSQSAENVATYVISMWAEVGGGSGI